jgi:hypothetical protein
MMDARVIVLLIMGGGLAGASFASVPQENRGREWPVMGAAFTAAGLAAALMLRRRAGLPVPPGQRAIPVDRAEVIQMPVRTRAA